ncbi:Fic family protein [Methylocystis suflitae]|uniref:Fic family protein n=1 Tax=Methylocystis suflitae TaxID=2951405 RepID=UPI00210CC103|nr:Fic family protein [Methylocystis suflitae]MCQ4190883.1 Fic family protein [Methylocystis suflitae]
MTNLSDRSGKYALQPSGYKAFIPAPLPPDPPVEIDSEMQWLLSEADRALGRLDGSIQTLPNPELFAFMYVRKEAVLSSQIEGTQASINDLLKAEAKIFDSEAPNDVDEVLNYVAAMNYGLARLREIPLSIRLIKELHQQLLKGVRGRNLQPGELRRSQNWIGPAGSTLSTATFIPPPYQEAEAALGELEKFLHASDELPPLIKIGLAHAQFETIHPFLDGNGRIGRLLITFFLCQQNILQKPVLYLSHYFKQHRSEYYEKLQRTRVSGDWEGWLKFFLRGVADVGRQATDTAREIVDLREKHRHIIMNEFGGTAANANKLLEYLYSHPTVSVNGVKELLQVSFPNANSLVEKFCKNQILFEITGQARNRVFSYSPYINLFANL